MKIINYEEKEIIPLTDEENKSCEEQKVCHTCKKKYERIMKMRIMKMRMIKNLKSIKKLKITVMTPENLEELLIAFAI